ncbi:hypothetical protein SSX86_019811 [Deinandra increscens subsp. villosa]|uniref:Uncharacterized protein n=1 Tax=Deinandra increscens subsp. villosa TaxID=3103831 RepID=A0AAP0GTD5_9ASTR
MDPSKNAISFWNKKNLKQREVLEIKKGGFGKGRFKASGGDQDDGNLADKSPTDSMAKQSPGTYPYPLSKFILSHVIHHFFIPHCIADQDVNKGPEVTDNDNANFYHMAKSSDENQEDAYDPSNDHEITQLDDDEHVHGVAEDQNKTALLADLLPTFDVNPQPSYVTATHLHVDLNSSLLFNGKLSVAPNKGDTMSPDHQLKNSPKSNGVTIPADPQFKTPSQYNDIAGNIIEHSPMEGNLTNKPPNSNPPSPKPISKPKIVLHPDETPKWTLGMTQMFEESSSQINEGSIIPINHDDFPKVSTGTPPNANPAPNDPYPPPPPQFSVDLMSPTCEKPIQVPFSDEEIIITHSSPNHPLQAIPICFAPSAEKLEETLKKLDSLRVNPIRNKTLSSVLKSPWLDRAVNIDLVPTKEEKKIWDILFNYQTTAKFKPLRKTLPCDPPLSYPSTPHTTPGCSELVFYSLSNVEACKGVMQTLMFDVPVNIVVIEAWE